MKLTTSTGLGKAVTLTNPEGNTFFVECPSALFTKGMPRHVQVGDQIMPLESPQIGDGYCMVTRKQIIRMNTEQVFIDGKNLLSLLFYKAWTDSKGRAIRFAFASDLYYYFRRPDCGVIIGEAGRTTFHRPLREGLTK